MSPSFDTSDISTPSGNLLARPDLVVEAVRPAVQRVAAVVQRNLVLCGRRCVNLPSRIRLPYRPTIAPK